MTTKLTLRLDETVIRKAKKAARKRGVSVSRMVEDYFKSIERNQDSETKQTPVLSELAGVLSGKTDGKSLTASYRKHLTEKYR